MNNHIFVNLYISKLELGEYIPPPIEKFLAPHILRQESHKLSLQHAVVKLDKDWGENILNYTLGLENFDEIALSVTVKKIEAFLCFCFSAKIRKFKMVAIFGQNKNCSKLGRVYSLDTLCVTKFRHNHSIANG